MHRFLHRLGRRIQIIISIQKQKGDAKHLLFVFVAAGGNAEPLQEASDIENKAATRASCRPAPCAGLSLSPYPHKAPPKNEKNVKNTR